MENSSESNFKNRKVYEGVAHIYASFNNTIITITDNQGNTICWSSPGRKGFKGSKKRSPFAAQKAAEDAIQQAKSCCMKKISIQVKGVGPGRDCAIRAFKSIGIKLTNIKDLTSVPHNGCRAPKERRV